MKEVYIKIKGRVQGIGYRWFAVNEAKRIGGLSGWVHNAADGSVEILMRGAEDKIDEMILACRRGPSLARVDSVDFIVGRISSFLPEIEEGVFKRV
ncbi:MAG: acylphosphatase [Alphaproteobacteria bacterium]|nr:acylphosphatase [Alphaproteobacteria bacterium]